VLSYIKLKNFKSFSNITLDLRGNKGIPKKMAFIYGENGSGKSNLMFSLLFLSKTLNTLMNQEQMKKVNDSKFAQMMSELKDSTAKNELLEHLLSQRFFTLEDLINEYITLDSKGMLEIEIGFYINDKEGSYSLAFEQDKVVHEELRYQVKERVGIMYLLKDDYIKMSPSVFKDPDYTRELRENIEKYWGKHTFMSILFNERATKNRKFVESRLNKNLFEVLNWLGRYSVLCKNSYAETAKVAIQFDFLRSLKDGSIKKKDDRELFAFEKVLNEFFTQLYSDIKKVYYKLTPKDDGFDYELYLKKLINGKILDVPFSLESTGTQKILDVFPFMFSAISGSTVLVDEVDSGIHDLLMCNIIELVSEALEESVNGQFIVTTHNTLLMKQLPNDNVYILRADAQGNKDIVTIDEYKFRTQKTNSKQSKYLNGDYSGIPFIGYLDLSEMVEDVIEYIQDNEHDVKER